MKIRIYRWTLGATFLMLAMTGCNKIQETPAETSQETTPVETSASAETTEAPKVATAPPPIPEPEKAPEPELAPEGIWFLRQAVSFETDSGIIGVKRGTQVAKTGEQSYRTPTGEVVTLSPDQVTNVLAEIRQILAAEHMSAAALAQWKAEQARAEQEHKKAVAAATPIPPGTRVYSHTTTTSEDGSRTITTQVFRSVPETQKPRPATPTRNAGSLSSGGLGATHGKVDFSDAYNAKQEANRLKGMR